MRVIAQQADRCGALGILRYQDWLKDMPEWEAQDHQKFLIPMGAWKSDSEITHLPCEMPTDLPLVSERERYVSELMRQNILRVVSSWRPALLINGFPEESVDQWISKAQDEIVNRKSHIYVGVSSIDSLVFCDRSNVPCSFQWQASWALKPGREGTTETPAVQ